MENEFFTFTVPSPLGVTSNELLQDADPVLYYILKFYKAVIILHTQDRWTHEIAQTKPDLLSPVASTTPFDPMPFLQESQFKFPLLSVFRTKEAYQERTSTQYFSKTNMSVFYIMPPLSPAQMERLNPFRTHVARTIVNRTEQGFDTNYNSGQNVWKASGLAKVRVLSTSYGNIPTETNSFFPTVVLDLEVEEQVKQNPNNFQLFNGMDGYVSASDNAIYNPLDFEVIIK